MQNFVAQVKSLRIIRVPLALISSIMIMLTCGSSSYADPVHIRLTPNLVSGRSIGLTYVDPNHERVAYISDQEIDEQKELYVIPLRGGTPTKLNPPLMEGRDVYDMQFAPNGNHIVYRSDQETQNVGALYSVAPTGGSTINISGAPPEGSSVFRYRISPDSKWVVYDYEKRPFDEYGLMSTPIDKSNPVSLTPPSQANGYVGTSYAFTPDSQRVIYSLESRADGHRNIYSVPIQGGTVVTLTMPQAANETVAYFSLSPDGQHVLYMMVSNGRFVRYNSVPVTGGESITLWQEEQKTLNAFDTHQVRSMVSPDGSKVLILANNFVSRTYQLYLTSITGGDPLLLSSSSETEGEQSTLQYAEFVQNGSGVVFTYDVGFGGYTYYVAATGGEKKKLVGSDNGEDLYYYFAVAPDGKKVIHTATPSLPISPGTYWLTDLSAGTTITLTTKGSNFGPDYDFSPDGASLIFLGKTETGTVDQYLRASLTDGSITTLSVDSTLSPSFIASPGPLVSNGELCFVYTLGEWPNLKEIYTTCYEANWPYHQHLPLITR